MITAVESFVEVLKEAAVLLRDSPRGNDQVNAVLHQQSRVLLVEQQKEIERLSKLVKP